MHFYIQDIAKRSIGGNAARVMLFYSWIENACEECGSNDKKTVYSVLTTLCAVLPSMKKE